MSHAGRNVAVAVLAVVLLGVIGQAGAPAEQGRMRGKRLPALTVGQWMLGNPSAVGSWGDGKVYVLDLWGTWCPPCVANIPELTRLQAEFGARGLVVIGYSWEKPETLASFVTKMGDRMRYHVASDPSETLLTQLTNLEAVEGFPYAFLIGRDGRVVWEGHPKDNDLDSAVRRLFARDGGR